MSTTHGISEIVLVVDDVEESARFYREVVGLTEEVSPADGWAWFLTGDGEGGRIGLRNGSLLFEEHSPLPEGERWGRVHFALRVYRDGMDESLARVSRAGVEVYGPTTFEWMDSKSYYFYDPDGNLVEFWSPEENREVEDETG